ncbi:MAG: GldG family protein [Candidatus Binatia bacterium]
MRSLLPPLRHSASHAVLLVMQVIIAGVFFGLLLLLAGRHNHRFDLTPTQRFVLSDQARGVARGVDVPIRITAFYNAQQPEERRRMEDLLQLFHDASSQITYRLADLDRSPALAKKYGVSSFNTGVIETAGTVRKLPTVDEEEITNGLLKLTRTEKRTLCFVTGHGEHSPKDASDRTGYSEVSKALEKENFRIRTLEVVPKEGVPTACTVVILAGPRKNLLPGEADQLSGYFQAGGSILLMVDPQAPASLLRFLARHSVRADNDVVVDERNRFYGADSFMPRVPIFDKSTFGRKLDTAAVFALARTVSPIKDADSNMEVLLIALTSKDSWARIDGGEIPEGTVRFRRELDKRGPLPVAVKVETKDHTPADSLHATPARQRGRMIVFGDSDFASNLYLNLLGNKDLFMSSIGVLAEDQELIAMRRKGLPRSSLSPIFLTAGQGRLIFWTAVVVQPASFALLGLAITWRRRRRGSS